ncbi:hypothetical protein ILUMI_25602 [Ignelater luminosus]|uniref:Regulator of microtubule dynamics protein 1 n=1 Tax=Ignelater luminosus TaxID=2038154 RepID=A0A8K0C743_IGNLU|nr:hypothetical protein ILUMI_25602 [Ignelater luminosus]
MTIHFLASLVDLTAVKIEDFRNSVKSNNEKVSKLNRYWVRQSVPEVIQDADRLFDEEKYLEVYELLNRLKFDNNVDVQWRICRALFKMSYDKSVSNVVRNGMIQEAYDLISTSVRLDEGNANAHKWMAIVTDMKSGLEATNARVKSYPTVKKHLLKAAELNPQDVSVLYMLGKWCFDMTNFTWFQRKISSILFSNPPTSTYEEAYNYFLQAEEIRPRFYLPNLYMLGCTSLHMQQYFRARYYLNIAAHLPPRSEFERKCAANAKTLSNELQQFDVSKEALFYGLTFANSNFD